MKATVDAHAPGVPRSLAKELPRSLAITAYQGHCIETHSNLLHQFRLAEECPQAHKSLTGIIVESSYVSKKRVICHSKGSFAKYEGVMRWGCILNLSVRPYLLSSQIKSTSSSLELLSSACFLCPQQAPGNVQGSECL